MLLANSPDFLTLRPQPASIPFMACPMFSTHMHTWLTVNQSFGFSWILFTHSLILGWRFRPLLSFRKFICLHLVGQKYFRVNPFDFVRLTDCRLTDFSYRIDCMRGVSKADFRSVIVMSLKSEESILNSLVGVGWSDFFIQSYRIFRLLQALKF